MKFQKTNFNNKIKNSEKINYEFWSTITFLSRNHGPIKNSSLFCLYIIIFFVLCFFFYVFFYKIFIITTEISEFIHNYENIEEAESQNNKDRIIIVENIESTSIAEIIIQNHINYIPKISVIIPVYNAEDYLQTCLYTVINQTLKKIEIIYVDYGSTDRSLDILKKNAKKDKRIKVLKQKYINVGAACNAGLSIASGKYLLFLNPGDFYELNMLERMYSKITKEQSDIIICNSQVINSDIRLLNKSKFNSNLRLDLIPGKKSFSALEIANNIFQICEGWIWDKLFRAEFISSNNIRFHNISNFNEHLFTYTALFSAKSITTLKKKFYIKRYHYGIPLHSYRWNESLGFLFSLEKIIAQLKNLGLYDLMKESFWNWVIKYSILQLKYIDDASKENLFNVLHEKFNFWEYIDNSISSSNRYRAIHYIKYQNTFPTINIAYATNGLYFNTFLISLASLLKNSEFENINIILLYNDINQIDLYKINELKEIRYFTLQTLNVSNELIKDFPFINWAIKETWFRYILADKFPNIDKILYLDSNTIVRKTLLPLWEIEMKDKIIGAVEDISFSKDKAIKYNLKDNFYFNSGVLLINTKEWRKMKLNSKIINHIKKTNQFFYIDHSALNIVTDMKKIILNPEFNIMETVDNSCQYDYEYLELYKEADPTILHFTGTKPDLNEWNNFLINEFSENEALLNNILNMHLIIPVVLSSDENYSPFIYTTIVSILENAYATTYYIFFLLVPSNFPDKIKDEIMSINEKYKCSINFIYMEKVFENLTMKISHITYPTYYRLLIGDLLEKEFDKCLYLDVDMCVCKDLSELFNTDIENYYLAGVVAPSYYFSEEKHCKRLNLPSMKEYINAGMILLNLKKIRDDNMTQIFIELSKNNYNSQDQDVLNIACYGKILTLPPKYNAQVIRLQENNPKLKDIYNEQDIIEAKSKPHIIHYANKNKPWNYLGIYMEKFWWNIAQKTPYYNNFFNRETIYKNVLKNFWNNKKKKELNLDRPKSFLDKIQWMNFYDSTPFKTKLCDKYLVREWIEKKIGKKYLIPLLATYDEFDEIKFEKLPEQFVMKCSHGRRYSYYVKDKSLLNKTDAQIKIDKWLNENYAFQSGLELQYKDIHPKIMIEEYINNDMGDLKDYEFICFNGKPKFIIIDNRVLFRHNYYLYDLNWNLLSSKISSYFFQLRRPKKPKYLKKLLKIVSRLSESFIFVIISFYIINNKIFFGSIKFSFSKEIEYMIPKIFMRELSSLIKLPKLAYNIDTHEYYEIKKIFSLYPCYVAFAAFAFKLLYILQKK